MDLFEEFTRIEPGVSDAEFMAVPMGGRRQDFLAKTPEGAPVFLLHDPGEPIYTPGTTLKHVKVQYHVTCGVRSSSGTSRGQFAMVSCDASVPELFELFIRCVRAAVERLPDNASTATIGACVASLLGLFRALALPSRKEVAGLWAELFVVAKASDTCSALRAWHANPTERYDFVWSGGVIEVKATHSAVRVHDFALEQLTPMADGRGLVVSCLLQPLTNGVGIMDLALSIEGRLGSDGGLVERLWSNIASVLGSDFAESLDRSYDMSFADRNVAVFDMGDIPSPAKPNDSRVTNLRFSSDLSSVSSSVPHPALRVLSDAFGESN